MRNIAVVTGTRAEYGLLYWIIKGIHDDPGLTLQLIVAGMHLVPEFGMTVRQIEKDGFLIAERVDMRLTSDTEAAIVTSMGIGMTGFAKAYERLKPDVLVVLGDRFEILSAVAAAVPFRIAVAHIHGGESTEGSIDECIRHAITKMSHIHFTAAEVYKKKVIQMGELPEHVFNFGAPGIDNIYKLPLMDKGELCSELDLPKVKEIGIVTYHPVTLEKNTGGAHINELLNSVSQFTDIFWIFTLPNADTERKIIARRIQDFAGRFPGRGKVFASLGQRRYLSALQHAAVMVGNSSSGLLEAPLFRLPVVNIGTRQKGRMRYKNVIDVEECRSENIVAAMQKALATDFKNSLNHMELPYGTEGVSEKIVDTLKNISLGEELIKKQFYEYDTKNNPVG